MAREIKDEKQSEMGTEALQFEEKPFSPIQIVVDEAMEDTLVRIIEEDFESSKQARAEIDFGQTSKGEKLDFEKWFKGLQDLYNGKRIPKTIPWKYCSNRSLMIAAAIMDMLHARLFAAIVQPELTRFKPGGLEDYPKAERITKLMTWWFWVRSRMTETLDNWIKVNLGYGDSITESSWKAVPRDTGKSQSTPIVDEMGQQIGEDKQRIIELFESTCSKIYLRSQFHLQKGSKDIHREPVILEDTVLYRDLEEGESQGKFVNITNLLKEKLPFAKESVQGKSPEEAERIRAIKLRNVPVKVLYWYGNYDADGDGFAEDVKITMCPEYNLYIGGIQLINITKSGRRPLDYTKLDSRIECPEDNFGIGILEKVKELAEEIDAIFNQLTDGNTLSILTPGFYDPGGDLEASSLSLAPNRMTPVSDPQRNIYFPTINIQTEKLLNAIRLVLEFIERLTAASSYVLGKESEVVGGSGTATRTNAIVGAANERFALPSKRLREGVGRIIQHHLDLLQLNIPPGLEQRILGEDGQPLFDENELTAQGISGEFDAYLLEDPSFGSSDMEKEVSSMLYSVLMQNQIVATDPVKIYEITADLIKAYGKEPERYLGPKPDTDMIDSPEDENTLMVQGDFKRVKAMFTENHVDHIRVHMGLMQSPSIQALSQSAPNLVQEIILFNQQHIAEHMQMLQAMQATVAKFGGGQGGQGNEPGGDVGEGPGDQKGSGGPQTPGGLGGMEQASGPLGSALDSKRKSQGQPNPGSQV